MHETERTTADLAALEARVAHLEEELERLRATLPRADKATLILFSGEQDKALACLVVATAAAALDMETAVFFTFWGVNALKERRIFAGKDFLERAIECLTPRGPEQMGVSRLNMLGAGAALLRKMMKDKHVMSGEELLALARDSGVKLYACSMSMDVMGVRKEELLEGVEVAGVATYLAEARDSGITLFI